MSIMSSPSSVVLSAVIYITVGVLTDVWSGIWFVYLRNNPPHAEETIYWCYGFLLTGFALVIIGLTIGRLGRSARHAEWPPQEVTPAVAQTDQTAAARAPLIAPVNAGLAPTVVPNDR